MFPGLRKNRRQVPCALLLLGLIHFLTVRFLLALPVQQINGLVHEWDHVCTRTLASKETDF